MNPTLKPYPHMKDSGVEWLGEVPEHWEVPRIKSVLCERTQKGFPNEPLLAATQSKGVVRKEDFESRTVLALKDLHLLKLVCINDFVISLRSFQGGIEYARERGIISPAYTILYPSNPEIQRFLSILFKSKPFIHNLGLYVTGIRQGQNIDYEKLSRSRIPLPPLPEQAAIVKFLNHVDRKVKRFIRIKRKLIALLEEQKQVIIHNAVTRGLDPNVPMKDSAIEWLGEVPEHWEVWKLGHFCKVGNGSTPSRGNLSYWLGGHYPWLNSSCANEDTVTHADQFVTAVALKECHLPIVPSGSLLVAITGQGKTRGKCTLLQIESTINQHLAFITPTNAFASSRFLQRVLDGAYRILRAISNDSGSTKGALTCSDLKNFRVALPLLAEQQSVLEYLDRESTIVDTTITRAQHEIELLNEYRTRLISDVVTGKLDVREAAVALPEEVEEEELEMVFEEYENELEELSQMVEEEE